MGRIHVGLYAGRRFHLHPVLPGHGRHRQPCGLLFGLYYISTGADNDVVFIFDSVDFRVGVEPLFSLVAQQLWRLQPIGSTGGQRHQQVDGGLQSDLAIQALGPPLLYQRIPHDTLEIDQPDLRPESAR